MQTSKWIRNLLSYLPLLAMVVLAAAGVFVAKDLYQTSHASPVQNTPQLPPEQHNPLPREQSDLPPTRQDNPPVEQFDPELLIVSGKMDSCISPLIYTSLPPKCMAANGEFVQLPGVLPSNIFVFPVTPEGK